MDAQRYSISFRKATFAWPTPVASPIFILNGSGSSGVKCHSICSFEAVKRPNQGSDATRSSFANTGYISLISALSKKMRICKRFGLLYWSRLMAGTTRVLKSISSAVSGSVVRDK